MNYQPFPREAHFTAVDGNWTATIWFPAAVRHTSNKCSSRVPNINMCNPCANGHKSTPPPPWTQDNGRTRTQSGTHACRQRYQNCSLLCWGRTFRAACVQRGAIELLSLHSKHTKSQRVA